MRLLLLGCTGFIGHELVPRLLEAGHQITLVGRHTYSSLNKNIQNNKLLYLEINPTNKSAWQKGPLLEALKTAEGVINLVGEPIAEKRWTPSHRNTLLRTRLETTHALVTAMSQLSPPPKVLINASAVGYYGTSAEKQFSEASAPGEDFLSNLCKSWEDSASKKPRQTRLVIFRIGIVLGADGGALQKMLPLFRAGLGGHLGNGKQWMSWIHRTDLCQLIRLALENQQWSGVVNAVAPNPVSMSEFSSTLGKALKRPNLLPVPAIVLRLLLGDGAQVVLEGQRVESKQIRKLRYKFQYPKLEEAFKTATTPQFFT